MSFTMYIPTKIIFGVGSLAKFHDQPMPGKKALVVISNGKSTKANGYLDRLIDELTQAGVAYFLFDKVQANPLKSTIMAGAAAARQEGCDFVVALGGGSVLDAAKIIAMMATNPGDLWDYVNGGSGKRQRVGQANLPVICITTTAGTGSEVDEWGVVNNEETQEKIGCGGIPSLFPVFSIIDPVLMTTVPPKFTAYQGFDALFHSTECYISKAANLMSDMYALKAIENVGQYLPRAYADGQDLEAREHMAFANTLSGVVMSLSCCTSEHSLEHALSAFHPELPHGAGLIMISLAYYGHFIEAHVCDERFVAVARALGMTGADRPEDFLTALEKLQEACGVRNLRLADYGFKRDELGLVADKAKKTMRALFRADPVALSHDDCVAILEKSYQ